MFSAVVGRLLGFLVGLMPKWFIWIFAKHFIAGKERRSALGRVKGLDKKGFSASVDYIGEDAADHREVQKARLEYLALINGISALKLDADIALKLSRFGLLNVYMPPYPVFEDCLSALLSVVDEAKKCGVRVWIDAERLITREAAWFFARTLSAGHKNIGVRIQAYALDAVQFLSSQIDDGWRGAVGVCKGAYREPHFKLLAGSELYNNFLSLCELVVKSGCFLQIDTHDQRLIAETFPIVRGYPHEFGMLLGVNPTAAKRLQGEGEKVRIYIPYGEDFKGYTVRRIYEHPGYIFLPLRRT